MDITIHRATQVKVETEKHFEKDENCHEFWRRNIIITDERGNKVTVTVISYESLDVTI